MAILGYARVSTADQKLDLQMDALDAAGCSKIFSDRGLSGGNRMRPGLTDVLERLTCGDTLVVWRLDRLGRSVRHLSDLLIRFNDEGIAFRSLSEAIDTATPTGKLVFHIFSAVGEFERDLIRERTIHGMSAARKRGKHIGRPFKLSERDRQDARRLLDGGETVSDVAARLEVSPATLKRALDRPYGV
ncbi:MAG: recombinase family protein [Pseudomonadota bacterium]